MSSFWPADIELSDTQSPRDILNGAKEDWQANSDGVMDLVLQDAKSQSGEAMIIVHAKHIPSKRTATLLSVVHRANHPYPATIQVEEDNLPNFLRKSYHQSSSFRIAGLLDKEGHVVSNKWVSDTPPEFREKLAEAFNLGAVKSEILNLASVAKDTQNSGREESIETP